MAPRGSKRCGPEWFAAAMAVRINHAPAASRREAHSTSRTHGGKAVVNTHTPRRESKQEVWSRVFLPLGYLWIFFHRQCLPLALTRQMADNRS